jgi:hypothetical protein
LPVLVINAKRLCAIVMMGCCAGSNEKTQTQGLHLGWCDGWLGLAEGIFVFLSVHQVVDVVHIAGADFINPAVAVGVGIDQFGVVF